MTNTAPRGQARKARTRASFLRAAQEFLSENRVAVSIQEIADRAETGFGSFYNHFSSKDELFLEAMVSALEHLALVRKDIFPDDIDPAIAISTTIRLTPTLYEIEPIYVRMLTTAGTHSLGINRGVHQQTADDITRGLETRIFRDIEPDLAFSLIGGMVMGLADFMMSHDKDAVVTATEKASRSALHLLGTTGDNIDKAMAYELPQIDHVREAFESRRTPARERLMA